jgi:hypothetical protein
MLLLAVAVQVEVLLGLLVEVVGVPVVIDQQLDIQFLRELIQFKLELVQEVIVVQMELQVNFIKEQAL